MSDVAIRLPGVLAEIAESCGQSAALSMAAAFGGREVYIPRPEAIGEDHPIAQVVGLACARKMAGALAHGDVVIPMGPSSSLRARRERYRRMKTDGCTNSQIARALGVHLRTVERYGDAEPVETRQGNLFD